MIELLRQEIPERHLQNRPELQLQKRRKLQPNEAPDWVHDAVMYEIFVRRFSPEGNLKGVTRRLDYLKSLGINLIWLMPIFESPTDHGYGITDFYKINRDYGDMEDFEELLSEAHSRGIRVVLDFVSNHSSVCHPFFQQAKKDPESRFRKWYKWRENGAYHYDFDWVDLASFNMDCRDVREYFFDVARFWLRKGIDGFRCDYAWGPPIDFWKELRSVVKAENPDALLLAEALPASPIFHQDQFDMSFDTDLYWAIRDVCSGYKDVWAIRDAIRKSEVEYPKEAVRLRFLETHDEYRFTKLYGTEAHKAMIALLMALPGVPMIYYGQEFGIKGQRDQLIWKPACVDTLGLLRFTQQAVRVRKENPALRRGDMRMLQWDSSGIIAFARSFEEQEYLILSNPTAGSKFLSEDGLVSDLSSAGYNIRGEAHYIDLLRPESKVVLGRGGRRVFVSGNCTAILKRIS